MYNGPAQWEEHDAVSFEREIVKFAHCRPANAFEFGENSLDLDFNEL
jgi:hypothetical protein